MNLDLPIPSELRQACSEHHLVGDGLLSTEQDWLQPYDLDEVDLRTFNNDFDATTTTEQGLLIGAIRICNTGCEGYHLYVFRGPAAGEIWSDQRVPSGRLVKIANSLKEYLEIIRSLGKSHVEYWEQFDQSSNSRTKNE